MCDGDKNESLKGQVPSGEMVMDFRDTDHFFDQRVFVKGEGKHPDKSIHPLDWVIVHESDPRLVGNHPLIKIAYDRKIPGKVSRREALELTPEVAKVLGTEVKLSAHIYVRFFPESIQPKQIVFYEDLLTKVEVEGATAKTKSAGGDGAGVIY